MIEAKVNRRALIALERFLNANATAGPERETALYGIIQTIMSGARSRWEELAGERLKSTFHAYVAAIQPVEGDPAALSARVELVGMLANLVERGMSAHDLREVFLGPGKGRKTRKGTTVRVIPFRHQTPGTGYTAGIPMGASYAGHAEVADPAKLGKAVYRAALKLDATTSDAWSERFESAPGRVQWGGRLPAGVGGAPLLKPTHKSDIYASMYRQRKTYENATQTQYITFRTITSDGEGWMHPGIPPANLAEEVEAYIEEIAVPAALAYLGKG